jgi:predicted enzyme related to lactoylglutathione lyase
MSETKKQVGSIGWLDLTVNDADGIRDFYSAVTGWQPEPLSMGEYNDYVMSSPDDGQAMAGVCHARGTNEGLPAQWLAYIVVADLDASIENCNAHEGKLIVPAKNMGGQGRYCVIQDPAGAVIALFEPA